MAIKAILPGVCKILFDLPVMSTVKREALNQGFLFEILLERLEPDSIIFKL